MKLRYLYSALAMAGVIFLSGCAVAPPVPLGDASRNALRGAIVVSTVREVPTFYAMTPGAAAFALVGALAAAGAGNKIVADNQITDPTVLVTQNLQSAMAATEQTQAIPTPLRVNSSDEGAIARMALALPTSPRWVLDVETTGWQILYYFDLTHYRVVYFAHARLIDVRTGQVVSKASCRVGSSTDHDDTVPTYDQMLANGAARLKQAVAEAAGDCSGQLVRGMLKGGASVQ